MPSRRSLLALLLAACSSSGLPCDGRPGMLFHIDLSGPNCDRIAQPADSGVLVTIAGTIMPTRADYFSTDVHEVRINWPAGTRSGDAVVARYTGNGDGVDATAPTQMFVARPDECIERTFVATCTNVP